MAIRLRDKIVTGIGARLSHQRAFRTDESGASAVEYGLLVSLIAVALIVSATALGSALGVGLFQGLASYFS